MKRSAWDIKNRDKYPKLSGNQVADVLVVGGGLAGLWSAYCLARQGHKVVVLEKDKIACDETAYTTAFITQVIDTPLRDLVEMFDVSTARAVWNSGAQAINQIETLVEEEGIDCDFMRVPLTIYAENESEYLDLAKEHLIAERIGFRTTLHRDVDIGFRHAGVLEIGEQAKFHPAKFAEGLARAAVRFGARIYEQTEVTDVVGNSPVKALTTEGYIVSAYSSAVVATYNPLGNPKAIRFKKGMYTSYCIELLIPKDSVREGLYIDMRNPYHYVRVDRMRGKGDRMIVGGEDHRSEISMDEEKNFKALREYAKETFPDVSMRLVRKWQGAILEPSDGLALIGETVPKHYVAAAFSGNGMTYSAMAGRLIADLIDGNPNPYAEVYDPKRRMQVKAILYKARDYTAELFGGAVRNIFK